MRENYLSINRKLVALTNTVIRYEKQLLLRGEFADITCNDIHIIEAVGEDEPKNMSMIAKKTSVTVGSLTTAMNALVKKGYVARERSSEDRRVVYITLTEKGRKVYRQSSLFHERVLDLILGECEEELQLRLYDLLTLSEEKFGELDPEILIRE